MRFLDFWNSGCGFSMVSVRVNGQWSTVNGQWSTVNSQQSTVNSQQSTVPLGTTEYRQEVECVARNPCIHDHDDIKSAEGTTEMFFCRAFSTLMFLQSYFAGISHCVLHHLPGNCRPYRTFLSHQVYKSGSEFRVN